MPPPRPQLVFQFLGDYAAPHTLRRLQDDFGKAQLRVGELLTLGPKLQQLCEPASLRKEVEVALSPLYERRGGKGGNVTASMSGSKPRCASLIRYGRTAPVSTRVPRPVLSPCLSLCPPTLARALSDGSSGSLSDGEADTIEATLAYLGEIKQWLVYGAPYPKLRPVGGGIG